MKSVASIFRYKRNLIPPEMRKGLRVNSSRTGWPIYTSEASFSRGGYVPREIGPIYDPKTNTWQ